MRGGRLVIYQELSLFLQNLESLRRMYLRCRIFTRAATAERDYDHGPRSQVPQNNVNVCSLNFYHRWTLELNLQKRKEKADALITTTSRQQELLDIREMTDASRLEPSEFFRTPPARACPAGT
jgi:hypothetical protein